MNVYRKAYADQLAWLVTMATTPGATPGAIEEPEHTEKRRVFQRAPRPVGSARAVEQGEPV